VLASVVETKELAQTVVASLIAGVGVTGVFAIMIFGATRFADLRRDDRPGLAVAAGALALAALAVVIAAVVFGIIVMTTKS
jgi:hypothetical protein